MWCWTWKKKSTFFTLCSLNNSSLWFILCLCTWTQQARPYPNDVSVNRAIINKLVIKCNDTLDTHKPLKLVCLNLRVRERLRKAYICHSERRIYRGRAFHSQSQTALISQGLFPDPSQELSVFAKPTPPCRVPGTHTPLKKNKKTLPPQLGHLFFITCSLSLKVCPAWTFMLLFYSYFDSVSFHIAIYTNTFKQRKKLPFLSLGEFMHRFSFIKITADSLKYKVLDQKR